MSTELRQKLPMIFLKKGLIARDCPELEPIPEDLFFLTIMVALLLILVGVTVYKKA